MFAPKPDCKTIDPRVRRTLQLLHDALDRLLASKEFEAISVQDITDAATLNRATFYDHYPDKTALLKCMVAVRFQALLDGRGVRFENSCESALAAFAQGVCDYLSGLWNQRRSLDPHLESEVIGVVKDRILHGLRRHAAPGAVPPPEMTAAAVSWAIYGGAKEWLNTPDRPPSEQAAATIAALLKPVLSAPAEPPADSAR